MLRHTLALIAVAAVTEIASAQPVSATETRLFELRTYHTSDGKLDDLNARFRDCATRLFEHHGITNVGFWTPTDANGSRIVFLLAYPSSQARDASWARLCTDPEWRKCRRETERDGKLVERIEQMTLVPTADCPVVAPSRGETPRSFELRTYATKPGDHANHKALCEKFRDSLVGCWTAAAPHPTGEMTHVYLLARERPATDKRVPEVALSDQFHISTTGGRALPSIRPRPAAADGGKGLVLQPTDYSPLR